MPVSESTASAKLSGVAGALLSTVIVNASERTLTLPAASVALAETLCSPSARIVAVKLQSPEAAAVTVPRESSPENSSTVAPASAVPVKVSVLSLVSWSLLEIPESESAASAKFSGASGEVVSMVMASSWVGSLKLLSESRATALMLWSPSPKATEGSTVKLQSPDASASPPPKRVSSAYRLTQAFASALAVNVGVVSLVILSLAEKPLSETAARSRTRDSAALKSTVISTTGEVSLILPAASPAVTVTL